MTAATVLERESGRRVSRWRGTFRLRGDTDGDEHARWMLSTLFAAGAAVVALLAIAAIVLGSVAIAGLNAARAAQLDQFAPVRQAGEDLSVALLNQETGVRGFGLAQRSEFLEPYMQGRTAEQESVALIRGVVAEYRDRPEVAVLGPALDRLEVSVGRWRTQYAEPIIATGTLTSDVERGRDLFNAVRADSDALLGDIRNWQSITRADVSNASNFLVSVAIAVAVVLIVVLLLAALGLRYGVLRPVSHLAAEVRAVVSGDMSRPVAAEGPREIYQLSNDVEAMRQYILAELEQSQTANRRLDEQARDLERSNRDLEQFAYVASHDLQEPLRKVSSFCQLLQRRYGGQLDERADQYIGFAVDGAQRMQRLINDLLSFSRVGRNTDGFTPVDLAAVAHSAVGQLEAARAEVEGTVEIGELPTVQGDQGLLRQLLLNLVGNGLKFHRDGVPPIVRVDAVREDANWVLSVSDNGIGIDPEYEDKVFIIFQRLHGRDVYPGTGIGLSLAKKIAEFHGGRIQLVAREPDDGPGATLRVFLPVAPEPLEPSA